MSQIKSEAAKAHLKYHKDNYGEYGYLVRYDESEQAVILAETELSELHTKQLQEMQYDIDRYITDLDEAKQREAINDRILADKRKEIEMLEKQLQELKEERNMYKSLYENNESAVETSQIATKRLMQYMSKAAHTHRQCCPYKGDGEEIADNDVCYLSEQTVCRGDCLYMKTFLTELNK